MSVVVAVYERSGSGPTLMSRRIIVRDFIAVSKLMN
jgi:hypothetical protein